MLALVLVGAASAKKPPEAAPRLPRVAVADFSVAGPQPRSWLGPLYGQVLAQRLRGCLEILLTEPLEVRPWGPVTMTDDVNALALTLVAQAKAVRAAFALGGLVQDLGETLVVTTVVAPSGAGKPLVVAAPPVKLADLFKPQVDVVVGRFLGEMGVKLSPVSFKAVTDYTPALTPATMELVGKGWRTYAPEDPEPAFRLWRQARALDSHCALAAEALAATGLSYRRRLQEEAFAYYQSQAANAPDDAMAQYHLADVLGEQGRWAAAEQLYKQVVTLRPNFVEAYIGWGRALLEIGLPEQAVQKFDGALVLEPEQRRALYNKGVACYRLSHFDAARLQWLQVLKLYPDDAEATAALKWLASPGGAGGGGGR